MEPEKAQRTSAAIPRIGKRCAAVGQRLEYMTPLLLSTRFDVSSVGEEFERDMLKIQPHFWLQRSSGSYLGLHPLVLDRA